MLPSARILRFLRDVRAPAGLRVASFVTPDEFAGPIRRASGTGRADEH